MLEKEIEALETKIKKKATKELTKDLDTAMICRKLMEEGKATRNEHWCPIQTTWLNTMNFFMSKPVVYLANIGKKGYMSQKNKYLPRILAWIKANGGGPMIPYSAEFEAEILEIAGTGDVEKRNEAAEEMQKGCTSMISKIVNVGYKSL